MTEGPGSSAEPGPLAEEAAKLLEALQDWLGERAGGLGERLGGLGGGLGDRIATGSTECQLCPVCQLIGLLRAAQPAVVEHLADASASLLAALAAALEAHERQWSAHRSARRDSGVEHIDISE
jgi:hypothetical protein